MSLRNNKKHIAFCKACVPKSKNTSAKPKSYFCLELEDGGYIVHITQASKDMTSKFSAPAKIEKFLKAKKLLDGDVQITKKAKLVAGLMWYEGSKLQINITVKKGGGKSTLRGAMGVGKKLGLPAFKKMEYVTTVSEGDSEEDAPVSSGKLSEKEAKAIKMHSYIAKHEEHLNMADSAFVAAEAPAEVYEKLGRTLEKYKERKIAKIIGKIKKSPVTAFSDGQINGWITLVAARMDLIDALEEANSAEGIDAAREDIADTDGELTTVVDQAIIDIFFDGKQANFAKAKDSDGLMLYQLYSDFQDNPSVLLDIKKALGSWDKVFELEYALG